VYKQVREKYYQHSKLSHILINAPKQYIFNFLNEIKIFNKLISAWHDIAESAIKLQPTNHPCGLNIIKILSPILTI